MTNQFFLSGAIILLLITSATAQSGGQFAIEKSVIAGGGGQNSGGGQFAVETTSGQTVAGQNANNAAISLHAGFWNPDNFVPTSAEVTVGGRVITANGNGIRNVRVTLTDANGQSRTTLSGTFGYFRFTEVPSGATYIITVAAKRYQFNEPSQVHTVVENIDNINFVALGDQ